MCLILLPSPQPLRWRKDEPLPNPSAGAKMNPSPTPPRFARRGFFPPYGVGRAREGSTEWGGVVGLHLKLCARCACARARHGHGEIVELNDAARILLGMHYHAQLANGIR